MAGILAVVVTNQPVIARGELKVSELKVIHNKMDTLLGNRVLILIDCIIVHITQTVVLKVRLKN